MVEAGTEVDVLRRVEEVPDAVHEVGDAEDHGGQEHAHRQDHVLPRLPAEQLVATPHLARPPLQARGGEARHEAQQDEENDSARHDAPAVLRRQHAQRRQHHHHHDGPHNLRLRLTYPCDAHAHAHQRREHVAILRRAEHVAVDQLPAALLHRLQPLLLALCLSPCRRPHDGVVLGDVT